MSYTVHTNVGKFWIKQHSAEHERWQLGVENGILGCFPTASEAARVVGNHRTGWYNWDALAGKVSAPSDLSDWSHEEL